MNALRWTALFAILFGFAAAVFAQSDTPKAEAPATLSLSVEYDGGRTEPAKTTATALRIETDYGSIDFKLDKIKVLNLKPDGDSLKAFVELVDGNHYNGKLATKELTLEAGTLALADVRQIKVLHQKQWSLLAIAFGLVTLTIMEIVLGVDNIIFLAIVAGRLPKEQQRKARRIGLLAALGSRLGLLFMLSFILGLTKPVFTIPIPGLDAEAADLSWRDIILIVGGGFLIFKSVRELHHKLNEAHDTDPKKLRKPAGFLKTILLIAVIDIVFSLDSVITAVGMVDSIEVMIAAMVLAMIVMLFFAEPISRFVDKYPTVKVLALSFLILIGVLLVAEGMGQHIEKGYVYFAMAFAVVIEFVNMSLRPKLLQEAVADG